MVPTMSVRPVVFARIVRSSKGMRLLLVRIWNDRWMALSKQKVLATAVAPQTTWRRTPKLWN